MTLGRFTLITTVLLSFCAAASAGPVAHVLDTNSYNFQLNNGGGGAQATLDKTTPIEIFCVDFANDIYVPAQGYSAYLTTITSGSDLSDTRFGNVASSNWTSMNTSFIDTTDAGTINNATDLGRYQMAAFLVSQYSLSGGNNTSNNGIQQAIWDILDPKSYSGVYNTATDTEIDAAAKWYASMGGNAGSTGLNNFLANYRIVSDTTMKACGAGVALCGGFQEQITVVPEPRHLALMLMGLLLVGSAVFRKFRTAQRVGA
jgi:hypothetical protein